MSDPIESTLHSLLAPVVETYSFPNGEKNNNCRQQQYNGQGGDARFARARTSYKRVSLVRQRDGRRTDERTRAASKQASIAYLGRVLADGIERSSRCLS